MIIEELTEALREVGGRYVARFEFRSPHGQRTSHYIIFVSKAFLGYHIMKEIMFGLSSDVSDIKEFEYDPIKSTQLPLFTNLGCYTLDVLKDHLVHQCAGQTKTVRQIYQDHTADTPYTLRNVKDAIIALEAERRVAIDVPAEKRRKVKGKVTLADERRVSFPK